METSLERIDFLKAVYLDNYLLQSNFKYWNYNEIPYQCSWFEDWEGKVQKSDSIKTCL